jgi:hypothetical protein
MGTADAFFHIGWNQWTVVTHEGGQTAYCTYPDEVSAKAAADSYNERANRIRKARKEKSTHRKG